MDSEKAFVFPGDPDKKSADSYSKVRTQAIARKCNVVNQYSTRAHVRTCGISIYITQNTTQLKDAWG